MKRILFLALVITFPYSLFAADMAGADPGFWEHLLPTLITIVVPILISLGRQLIPLLPKWLLPILAPALGAVLAIIVEAAMGQGVGIIMGAVYGGLGTWLREFIKQIQQASQQTA
jgi:hypothetical protein